jgi:hypothetical protein
MKKIYVKKINFDYYITMLPTRVGSPICKAISRRQGNFGRQGNEPSQTLPSRPPRSPRRWTMPRPQPLPIPLDDDIVSSDCIQITITHMSLFEKQKI